MPDIALLLAALGLLAVDDEPGGEAVVADVWPWAAGSDCFIKKQSKDVEAGESIADQYAELGLMLNRANVDRVNGAARLLDLLGDSDADPSLPSRLSVYSTCGHLIEQIPAMVHDPNRPEDVKKVDVDDDGHGGDDPYDAARYGLMVASAGARASVAVGRWIRWWRWKGVGDGEWGLGNGDWGLVQPRITRISRKGKATTDCTDGEWVELRDRAGKLQAKWDPEAGFWRFSGGG